MDEVQQPGEQPGSVRRTRYQKLCPYCSERIPGDARKCRYCGEMLEIRAMRQPPPAKSMSTCLILVIVAAVGAVVIVPIIAIIAAIAIPNLLKGKIAAYELGAMANLRTISSAEELYNARNGTYGTLQQLAAPGIRMIDNSLAQATSPGRAKSGYYYRLVVDADGQSWSATAIPAEPGITGTRSFYIDHTGAVRYRRCENRGDPPADSRCRPLGYR